MLSELKSFLFRGDVLSLAVAVVIAGAFQKIVDSLVLDVITPAIGMIVGQTDFSGLMLGEIKIGNLITVVVNFLIVGTVLFLVIKAASKKVE
jgi:large conductance mechanosensitive channel